MVAVATWFDEKRYDPSWSRRAKRAARFIRPGERVVDLGCGQMHLRDFLPAGCTYTPSDVKAWTPEVIVCDLDKGEFPEGEFDVATFLGVVSFLEYPASALKLAHQSAGRLIVSFKHAAFTGETGGAAERRHEFSRRQMRNLITSSGWAIEHEDCSDRRYKMIYKPTSWLYIARRA